MKRGVLITDGEQRAALAIVRSIGRAGYRCVVCSTTGRSLAGASRFASKEVRVPDPAGDPVAHTRAVEAIVRDHGIDLLIPVTDASLLSLLPGRACIDARIPFPDIATFRAVCDKGRVLQAARDLGIRVPRQRVIDSQSDQDELVADLPVVLKPTRSVYTAADGTRAKVGVRWARTPPELRLALASYPPAAYPILAQHAVEGPGIGIFVLLHDGRLLARFSHRRIREKPPSGGVSVVRQSEPMDDELLEMSVALLRRFGWEGVAMVEYKRDRHTGEHVLMEINGRFWGSLQLAVDAGVDFPRILADATLGKAVDPVKSYAFTRSRWLWGDVDHVIARWRDPRARWSDRAAAAAALVRGFGPGYRNEVFRWMDPRPFIRESMGWLKQVVGR